MKKNIGAIVIAIASVGLISVLYHIHMTEAPARAHAALEAEAVAETSADTLCVNTTDLAKDVIGFNGTTPLLIKLVDGRIVAIEALPNAETPGYFRRVKSSPLFTAPIGKTPAEVLGMQLDAVSGATFSSKAVIENLHRGLKSISE